MQLQADNLSVVLGDQPVLHDVSLAVEPGELVVLLGPNGSGKSTLLRALLGLVPYQAGACWLGGELVAGLSVEQRATRVSYLPQTTDTVWPLSVFDVVALGLYGFGARLGRLSAGHSARVHKAIDEVGLAGKARRPVNRLSGGEQARVHLARVLVAQTPLVVADEPITSLDPKHQLSVLGRLKSFTQQGGAGLLVLHDLTLAAQFADRLIWLDQGEVDAAGTPGETLTADRVERIYGVTCKISGTQVAYQPL